MVRRGIAAKLQASAHPSGIPGLRRPFVDALAPREIDRMVARCLGPQSGDREARVDFQAGARRFDAGGLLLPHAA
jgi:hypothetical protein